MIGAAAAAASSFSSRSRSRTNNSGNSNSSLNSPLLNSSQNSRSFSPLSDRGGAVFEKFNNSTNSRSNPDLPQQTKLSDSYTNRSPTKDTNKLTTDNNRLSPSRLGDSDNSMNKTSPQQSTGGSPRLVEIYKNYAQLETKPDQDEMFTRSMNNLSINNKNYLNYESKNESGMKIKDNDDLYPVSDNDDDDDDEEESDEDDDDDEEEESDDDEDNVLRIRKPNQPFTPELGRPSNRVLSPYSDFNHQFKNTMKQQQNSHFSLESPVENYDDHNTSAASLPRHLQQQYKSEQQLQKPSVKSSNDSLNSNNSGNGLSSPYLRQGQNGGFSNNENPSSSTNSNPNLNLPTQRSQKPHSQQQQPFSQPPQQKFMQLRPPADSVKSQQIPYKQQQQQNPYNVNSPTSRSPLPHLPPQQQQQPPPPQQYTSAKYGNNPSNPGNYQQYSPQSMPPPQQHHHSSHHRPHPHQQQQPPYPPQARISSTTGTSSTTGVSSTARISSSTGIPSTTRSPSSARLPTINGTV
ncbi:unnamed protein product [[Candida] boidinii]|nr:unnamed protein product [[Candida] boidinii]